MPKTSGVAKVGKGELAPNLSQETHLICPNPMNFFFGRGDRGSDASPSPQNTNGWKTSGFVNEFLKEMTNAELKRKGETGKN